MNQNKTINTSPIQSGGTIHDKPRVDYNLTHRKSLVKIMGAKKPVDHIIYYTSSSFRHFESLAKTVEKKGLRNINLGLVKLDGSKSVYRLHFTVKDLNDVKTQKIEDVLQLILSKVKSFNTTTILMTKLRLPVIFDKENKDYPLSLIFTELE